MRQMIGDSPNILIASPSDALAAAVDVDQGDAAALAALEAEGFRVGELQRQLS